MRFGAVLILTALAVGLPAEAFAQTPGPAPEATLSSADRTAITGILDALATQRGEALSRAIVNALNNPGVDSVAVVRAVKVAAGTNLTSFQSILVQTCLGGGGKFCKLAAIQAPSQASDVKTAATNSGDGPGGGGGGFGGTPQTNGGHYGGGAATGSLFDAAGLDQNFQNFGQNVGVPSGSGGVATTLVTTSAPTIISTSGPVAGTGLPIAVLALGWSIWRRRHWATAKMLAQRAFP